VTDRRSFQTWTERMSRQAQFVPGHVGGRVASAQPVKRRVTVGRVSAPQAPLPTFLGWGEGGNVTTGQTSWDADPRNNTSTSGAIFTNAASDTYDGTEVEVGDLVVALVFGFNCGWSAPTGWTVVDSGDNGTTLDWLCASRVINGSDDWTFDGSTVPTWSTYSTRPGHVFTWHFRGGSGTPSITATTDTTTGAETTAIPTIPTGGWHAYAAKAVGTGADQPDADPWQDFYSWYLSGGLGGGLTVPGLPVAGTNSKPWSTSADWIHFILTMG